MLNHALQVLNFLNCVVIWESNPAGDFGAWHGLEIGRSRQVASDRTGYLCSQDMVTRKIVMNVFHQQVPAGLKWLAGLFKSSGAIDKAERVTVGAGGNFLNDLIYLGVGPKSQRVQIQRTLIVSFGLLKFAEAFEGGSEPKVSIGIIRINLQSGLKMPDSLTPVLCVGALSATTG